MKSCLTGLAILLASNAFAADFAEPLKAQVISKFTQEANRAGSPLAKAIAKINEETSDGRNPNGSIALPVTADSLQVIVLEGEQIYRPFHYSSFERGRCMASGISATLLIVLSSSSGVHGAQNFSALTYMAAASQDSSSHSSAFPD